MPFYNFLWYMKQNLQVPFRVWKIKPTCYYRNEDEVKNICSSTQTVFNVKKNPDFSSNQYPTHHCLRRRVLPYFPGLPLPSLAKVFFCKSAALTGSEGARLAVRQPHRGRKQTASQMSLGEDHMPEM